MTDETAISQTNGAAPARTDARDADSELGPPAEDSISLTEDVAEWLRLKVQLLQIEVHERISNEVNTFLSSVLVLGLLLVAILLLMMALGLFIGELLDNFAYGFAIAAGMIAFLAILLGRTQPQWIGRSMQILVPRRWLRVITRKHDDTQED